MHALSILKEMKNGMIFIPLNGTKIPGLFWKEIMDMAFPVINCLRGNLNVTEPWRVNWDIAA
jgi:hypothetical protein